MFKELRGVFLLRYLSCSLQLTDFGLAKIAKSASKVLEEKDEDAAGTTSYMPPEAFMSARYVPAFSSDVYR